MAAPIGGGDAARLVPSGKSFEDRLRFLEEITANCDEVQRRVLAEILTQNGGAEYLLRHGLGGATDRAAFKARIPVVSYEELRPEIQRIANGDASAVLSGRPVTEFLTSSGTSGGERKLMPSITEDLDRCQLFYDLNAAIRNKYIPGLGQGMRLNFMFVKSETKTPGGLPTRPAVTSYYKSDHFQSRLSDNNFTSPAAAILCTDAYQSMYVQLLCGLLHRLQVLSIGSVFASGLLRAIHFLQTHCPDLAHDIATGTLSASITIPSLRASVADILRPDPDLSQIITDECMKPDWASIITRIWPNTKYITVVTTGTMAQYIPTLEFYGGGLPLVSSIYASSECLFGLNLNPMCPPSEVAYTIMPYMGYFEFIESGIEGADLVDLSNVEVGKEYELVVTTYAGLYRYRVGDVLQVAKFHNAAPQFKFLRRKDVLLSIESDKTDENELQQAVEAAAMVLSEAVGASVVDYTSQACMKTIPGHYIIYWELLWRGEEGSPELGEAMEKCCLAMEEEMNSVYRQSRVADRSIGPLEIRVVRAGTFEELMDYGILRGASINQYKTPRCVSYEPILELLDSRIVSTHFSVRLPRWNPR